MTDKIFISANEATLKGILDHVFQYLEYIP